MMKLGTRKGMLGLLSIALALLVMACGALAEAGLQVGDECPDFELTTLTGETFRLSDCRGKVVFLNVWATWCPYCVIEMPDIQRLADAYPDALAVLGVSVDDQLAVARDFIIKSGCTYPIAMDGADYIVSRQLFPSYYIPNSVFIDPNGVVTYIGASAMDYETMLQLFRQAQAG